MNQKVTRRGISCLFLAATFALGACGGGGGSGGSGTGTVVSGSPVSIQPSVASQSSNQGSVTGGGSTTSGQSVTLTATSNSGFVFVRWTENGNEVSTSPQYTFTASANRQLVAHFMHDVNGIWLGVVRTTTGDESTVTAILHNGDFVYYGETPLGQPFYYAGTYAVVESAGTRRVTVQQATLYQTGAGSGTSDFTAEMAAGKTLMAGDFTTSFGERGTLALAYVERWHEQHATLGRLVGQHDLDESDSYIASGATALTPVIDSVTIRQDGSFTAADTDDGTTCSASGSITLPNPLFNLYRVTATLSRGCAPTSGEFSGMGLIFPSTLDDHNIPSLEAALYNGTYMIDIDIPITNAASNPVSGFRRDVYEHSSTFRNRCASPRTTPTTIGGQTYTWRDIQGTLLDEKYWIRSFVNEEYLWYDEVRDVSPHNTDSRTQYFERMRTFARTASGKYKDEFSDYQSTEDELLGDAGINYGYGMTVANLRATPQSPNNVRVLFTEPGSPAAMAGIGRGDKILQVDTHVLNALRTDEEVNAVNAALFNPSNNASHSFKIQDRDTMMETTVTLTAQEITEAPVHNVKRIVRSDGSAVGYMTLNTFGSFPVEAAQRDAIQQLVDEGGVDDLVLDLRYNGGGIIAFAAQLGYMIAGDWSKSQTFVEYARSDKQRSRNARLPFVNTGSGFSDVPRETMLPTLNIGPRTRNGAGKVYILSSGRTCSASELIINGLRGVNVNVVQIGTTTCGKPYGFIGVRNCGVTYYPVMIQSQNAQGFGDYADGFKPANAGGSGVAVPGCHVPGLDDVSKDLGDVGEARLKAALNHRANGTCPPVTAAAPPISDAAPNPFPIVIPPGHVEGFRGAILREDF